MGVSGGQGTLTFMVTGARICCTRLLCCVSCVCVPQYIGLSCVGLVLFSRSRFLCGFRGGGDGSARCHMRTGGAVLPW